MSCNTCQCNKRNALLCTKMGCFDNVELKEVRKINHEEVKGQINKKYLRILPSKEHYGKNKLRDGYLELPAGKCQPGIIYRKGCRKCFCTEKMVAVCTRACSSGFPIQFNDKEISEIESRSALELPELPHMGSICRPGRTYYVVCNICFCTHKRDLLCSAKYCINIASYAEVHSKELTGLPCKKDFKMLCTECKCVDKKNQCKPIANCGNNISGKQLLSSAGSDVKLTFDIKKERCKPNVTYKLHCNECYCQPDGSLRCTQKVCLTYSESKDLQEKETYLEQYGL